MHWYEHMLRRVKDHASQMSLRLEVEVRRTGRLKKTWKRQDEEENMTVGLGKGNVLCRRN